VVEAEGRVSEMTMYEEFLRNNQMLWIAVDDKRNVLGFISTKINQYAKINMASLEYCAGEDAEEWFQPLMNVIEKWAKEYHCDGIEMVCGRKGWTRKFKEAGFKDKFTWAEKRFEREDRNEQGQ